MYDKKKAIGYLTLALLSLSGLASILGISYNFIFDSYANIKNEVLLSKSNTPNKEDIIPNSDGVGESVGKEDSSTLEVYYTNTFDLRWPDLNDIFNYLCHNRFSSTFVNMFSNIYEIDIHVKDDEIHLGLPNGIYSEENGSKLLFDFVYSDDYESFVASSPNILTLTDFIGDNTIVYNILNTKQTYIAQSEYDEYFLEQKFEFANDLYTVTQKRVYKDDYKKDRILELSESIKSGEFLDDLDGYHELDDLSKSYLSSLVDTLNTKKSEIDIEIMVLPDWYLSEEDRSEENAYRFYNVKFKEKISSTSQLVLNIDGVDRFNVGRLYYLAVNDISSKNNLWNQKVADFLGLAFDDLARLLEFGHRYDGNISFSTFESESDDESLKDFVSVIRATYDYDREEFFNKLKE